MSVRIAELLLQDTGVKGCYVYFMDKEIERFVRCRVDK
jgi:hypothetical protein